MLQLQRVLNKILDCNMPGLIKTTLHHRCLRGSEYSSGPEYIRILNMPGLHKVLNKTLRYRYLIGF